MEESEKPVTLHLKRLLGVTLTDEEDGFLVGKEWAEVVALCLLEECKKGNVKAAKEVMDRVEGRVAEKIEIDDKRTAEINSSALELLDVIRPSNVIPEDPRKAKLVH